MEKDWTIHALLDHGLEGVGGVPRRALRFVSATPSPILLNTSRQYSPGQDQIYLHKSRYFLHVGDPINLGVCMCSS